MAEEIQVSVVMPVYNGEKYIRQAVESALVQQVVLELLVINDCSTDDTGRILEEYKGNGRVRVVENKENCGVAEARNIGIRLAKGKYIAFLDADDWWSEEKLAVQCELLEKKQLVLCCTARELMRPDGSSTGKIVHVPENITYEMLLHTNHIPCSSVVMKTEVAREFYMEHSEMHEDYILWLKVLKKYGTVCGMDEPMLKSRLSEGGKSRNKLKSARMQWKVYRFMGIGWLKSLRYMIYYVVNGLKKYS